MNFELGWVKVCDRVDNMDDTSRAKPCLSSSCYDLGNVNDCGGAGTCVATFGDSKSASGS